MAWQSPLFYEYYKGQPFNNNMLRPCPMLENPAALRRIVSQIRAPSPPTSWLRRAPRRCAPSAMLMLPPGRLPPSAFGRRKAASGPLPSIIGTPRGAKRTARCKSCKICPCLRRNKREHKIKKRTTLFGRALLCALIQNWFLRSSAPAPGRESPHRWCRSTRPFSADSP